MKKLFLPILFSLGLAVSTANATVVETACMENESGKRIVLLGDSHDNNTNQPSELKPFLEKGAQEQEGVIIGLAKQVAGRFTFSIEYPVS